MINFDTNLVEDHTKRCLCLGQQLESAVKCFDMSRISSVYEKIKQLQFEGTLQYAPFSASCYRFFVQFNSSKSFTNFSKFLPVEKFQNFVNG